jgi:hypothetical protein
VPPEFSGTHYNIDQALFCFPVIISQPQMVENFPDKLPVLDGQFRFRIRIYLVAELEPLVKFRFEHQVVYGFNEGFS